MWISFAAASVLAVALAGCGGGGSSGDTTAAAPPPAGGGGAAPPVTPPTGAAPVTLTATTPPATLAALTPVVAMGGVTISSPPVVTFSIADGATTNNAIIGLGYTRQTATMVAPALTNISFSLAKLVPGTNGSPSKWVNYIVTTMPAYKSATDKTIVPAAPQAPGADNTGTLKDNKNGTYTYTFYRDITKIMDQVAGMTPATGASLADLGDLTYDPKLVHRLTIQLSGNVWGTGTQTADGSNSGVVALPMANPVNVIYDFIPATGKAVTATDPSRDIVATAKCQECHSKLGDIPGATQLIDSADGKSRVLAGAGFHGGGRYDTKYCVVCHTDQRKYNATRVVSTNLAFPALTRTVTAPTAPAVTYSQSYSGSSAVYDGVTVADFPAFVHKLHMGDELVKKNYNFGNVLFNEITYPQPRTNCAKCHDGSATSTAKTANGDNWKTVPSRLACGACHDGIDFAKNTGVTLADARAGKTSSSPAHIGGAKTDDTQCVICHGVNEIPVYHVTVDPELSAANSRAWYNAPWGCSTAAGAALPCTTVNQVPAAAAQLGNLPSDVHKVNFEISQVAVAGAAGAKLASVKYRVLIDGKAATMNATAGTMLFDKIDGSPSVYVAYAVPQDGIASPADWNANVFDSVRDIRDKKTMTASECAAPSSVKTIPSQTGPDVDGYYTATLGCLIPDNATMVTGAIGINYPGLIQLDAAAYPKGILLREPQFAMKTADNYTARRQVVANAKCNNCHGQLGILPTFHGGARNNGEGCAICHQPNTATGHVGAANNFGGGWSVAIKNLVHGIHGSSKRTEAYSYEATAANPGGFKEVTYPGVLKNCEQCHVAGSYDYSGAAIKAAVDGKTLLWFTDSKGDMTNAANAASIGLSPWVTRLGKGQINYTNDNLVSSPIASSCFGCHDSTSAVDHMQKEGGTLVTLFSSVASVATRPAIGAASTMTFTKSESCMFCHSSTSSFALGIKQVHAK